MNQVVAVVIAYLVVGVVVVRVVNHFWGDDKAPPAADGIAVLMWPLVAAVFVIVGVLLGLGRMARGR